MTKWFSSLYAGDKSYSIFQMINLFTFHFLCALPYPAIFISFTHSCQFGERDAIHISVCVCAELVRRRRQSPFRWIQWHARWSKETAKPANAFAWFSTYRLTEHTTAAGKKWENSKNVSMCVYRIVRSCHLPWQELRVSVAECGHAKRTIQLERERDVHQPTTI